MGAAPTDDAAAAPSSSSSSSSFGGFGMNMKMKMYKKGKKGDDKKMGGSGGFGDMKMKMYKKKGSFGGFGSAESMRPLVDARLTGSEMGDMMKGSQKGDDKKRGGFGMNMKMKMYKKGKKGDYKKMGGFGDFGDFGDMKMKMDKQDGMFNGSDEAFFDGAKLSGIDESQMASVEAQMSDEGDSAPVSSGSVEFDSAPVSSGSVEADSAPVSSGSVEFDSAPVSSGEGYSGESPSGSAEFSSAE